LKTFGYARVSTTEQNLDTQLQALEKAGCDEIFQEKISGTLASRPELDRMLALIRPGDMVMVSRFFRLGRSKII
jgi:DNA invertase Pin-like site-specific DNA recombinase